MKAQPSQMQAGPRFTLPSDPRATDKHNRQRSYGQCESPLLRRSRARHVEFLRLCGRLRPLNKCESSNTLDPQSGTNNARNSSAKRNMSEYLTVCSNNYDASVARSIHGRKKVDANSSRLIYALDSDLVYGKGTHGLTAQALERKLRQERELCHKPRSGSVVKATQDEQAATGVAQDSTATKETQPDSVFDRLVNKRGSRVLTIREHQALLQRQGREREEKFEETLRATFSSTSKMKGTLGSTMKGAKDDTHPKKRMRLRLLESVDGTSNDLTATNDFLTSETQIDKLVASQRRRYPYQGPDSVSLPPLIAEERRSFDAEGGGIMDVFGYFSTHRVHPTFYRRMQEAQLVAVHGKVPEYRRAKA